MEDLEKILIRLPSLKPDVDKGWVEFKEKMKQSILSYEVEGITLEERALQNGRQDFLGYVDHVVEDKYRTLYTAHKIIEGLKGTAESIFPKGKGLADISVRFAGKKLLIPAYLALYVAEKCVNETMGQYYGLYDDGIKGRLNYAGDMIGLQANYVAAIVGFGSAAKKLGFADIEKRIIDTAVRDVAKWADTGIETRSQAQSALERLTSAVGSAAAKVENALKEYSARIKYSSDRQRDSSLNYGMVGAPA